MSVYPKDNLLAPNFSPEALFFMFSKRNIIGDVIQFDPYFFKIVQIDILICQFIGGATVPKV
jgi:hypothetical protein